MKKRALSLLLAVLMLVTVLPAMASAANMAFTDVPTDAWFYADVRNAFESGLIDGKSATIFAPNDNLTYAEAVKLAAAMHQKNVTGNVTLQNGNPWYQSYVDYGKINGIIDKEYAWNQAATRAGYMEIFAKALPDTALSAINTVTDGSIPDVPMSHPQAAAIYKLYRAGILQGSADYLGGKLTEHLCKPGDNIRRSEVAAILTRMMDASKRVKFSLGNEPALTVSITGTASGAAGTAVPITATVAGGRTPYSYQWQFSFDGANWINGTAGQTANTYSYSIAATPATQYVRLSVTDASGKIVTSNTCTVTIGGPLTVSLPNTLNAAAGVATTIKATLSGGKSPYAYTWQYSLDGLNWITGAVTKDYAYIPAASPATQYVRLTVKDADNKTVTTNTCTVRLTAAMTVTTNKTGTQNIVSGTAFTMQASVTGGTAPYKYQWQVAASNTETSYQNWAQYTNTFTYSFTGSSQSYIRVQVTDSNGLIAYSQPVLVVFKPGTPLSVTTDKTGTVTMQPGTLTATATAAGGTQPYTYQWQYSADGINFSNITGATAARFTYNFPTAGAYVLRVQVTDAARQTVASSSFLVRVGSAQPLSVTTDKTGAVTVQPGSFSVTATAAGGTQPYTYQWQYSADGFNFSDIYSASAAKFTYSFAGAGSYIIRAMVRDSSGQTVYSNTITVTVRAAQALAVTTDKNGIVNVQTGLFTTKATVTGGTGPYTYQWEQGSENGQYYAIYGATSDTFNYLFTDAGSVRLRVAVKDASGQTAYSNPMLIEISEPNSQLILTTDPSGDATVPLYGSLKITAHASGGTGTYSYKWEYFSASEGVWQQFGTNSAVLDFPCIAVGAFQVRITVDSGVQRETSVITVTVTDPFTGR